MPDIQAEIDRYLVERPSVGIVLALVQGDAITEVFSAGTTHVGRASAPDVDSVFRIASMTKSFTAAAVLLLRDRGQLRLDDPASDYIPWLPQRDITVRDLLTMNAGFPTDDPWGDRHEPTPIEAFDALVADGVSMIRDPRTGFEYSNLSYALLGRMITSITGVEYTAFVTRELLQPLGMRASTYDHRTIPDARVAQGHHDVAGEFVVEPQTLPGAFSPMGGLHSSARDLAIWVAGFLGAWHGNDAHPLSKASRLEMQSPQNFARLVVRSDEGSASSLSYGYGLLAEEHSVLGRFVHHSGGYPGFGSHMRWHPETGLGIIALSNRTYAAPVPLCERILCELVADATPLTPPIDRLWPRTREAMQVAERLFNAWDDDLASSWFAHNMDLDVPRAVRRDAAAKLQQEIGAAESDVHALSSRSAAHARWSLRGANGSVWVELLMSPDREPRIQSLNYATQP